MQVLIHFINLSKFGSFSNINVLKKEHLYCLQNKQKNKENRGR